MQLTENDFKKLSSFIYTALGIKMPEGKKIMLSSRISRRLRKLGLQDFSEYCNYLFSDKGQKEELVHFFDLVTTNKTDFFREPTHFDYLLEKVLPEISLKKRGADPFRIWSAGCSTGEEPYTMAMLLSQEEEKNKSFKFSILATDISTQVLEIARKGIYGDERVTPVPAVLRNRYMLKSRDNKDKRIRFVPELRQKIKFGRLNFMVDSFPLSNKKDVIFCRNVIIYFDRLTQEKLMHKFCQCMQPGGYLFLGHSESLHGMKVPLTQVAPTVYRYEK